MNTELKDIYFTHRYTNIAIKHNSLLLWTNICLTICLLEEPQLK